MVARVLCASFVLIAAASSPARAQIRDRPLREGDRVLVKLFMDTVFSDSVRLDDRGLVILPRVGPVSIEGLPAKLVADSVRNAYARVFRTLTVEATPLRRVVILGEVRRPQVYYLDPLTTVREAIAQAGGVTEIGKTNRITIVRDQERLRIRDWQLQGGDDASIRSGDIVIAEREPWIKRNAFTLISATSVLLSIGLTLAQL